jgi:hypothetical protein
MEWWPFACWLIAWQASCDKLSSTGVFGYDWPK